MIKLDIQPYCEDCVNFEADVETNIYYVYFDEKQIVSSVRCKNRKICENIKRYLERRTGNDVGKDD